MSQQNQIISKEQTHLYDHAKHILIEVKHPNLKKISVLWFLITLQ